MYSELSQAQAYKAYDDIVVGGRETLEEILVALREIHKKRLYLEEFDTFEGYVNARLNWSKSKAYRLLELTKNEGVASHDGTPKQQKQGENEEAELQDTAGQHIASVKHSTAMVAQETEPDIDTDETSRPHESTSFDPPAPRESSLDVDVLKELIENESQKIERVVKIAWKNMESWQQDALPEIIQGWNDSREI